MASRIGVPVCLWYVDLGNHSNSIAIILNNIKTLSPLRKVFDVKIVKKMLLFQFIFCKLIEHIQFIHNCLEDHQNPCSPLFLTVIQPCFQANLSKYTKTLQLGKTNFAIKLLCVSTSRYELLHQTLKLFYRTIKDNPTVSPPVLQQLETLFKSNDKGSKIVYTHTTSELKTKFEELGCLIYQVLDLFPSSEQT